jgi:hypothetical protein
MFMKTGHGTSKQQENKQETIIVHQQVPMHNTYRVEQEIQQRFEGWWVMGGEGESWWVMGGEGEGWWVIHREEPKRL